MAKFIALDIGEKRVGIARSDDTGAFCFPYKTIAVADDIKDKLEKIISGENPEKIVVGIPRNMDGSLGFQTEKVEEFVKTNLENFKSKLEYEDETVTSIEAEKLMKIEGKDPKKDKEQIDAYAAKIILESWISGNQGLGN